MYKDLRQEKLRIIHEPDHTQTDTVVDVKPRRTELFCLFVSIDGDPLVECIGYPLVEFVTVIL